MSDKKRDKTPKKAKTKAKINKQDTRHGELDLPFTNLNRYAGKAAGGDVSKMEQKHANWMKAHGAPAKMVKEERSEKMAKGGGVESKGKTKGKCIKMARGGGVEIKGKTRGKFI